MTHCVDVVTAARLHFGLICGPPTGPWHYGGIGLMVQQPGWHLRATIAAASTDELVASRDAKDRLRTLLEQFRTAYRLPAVRIETLQETGFHTGLGSGTQLTLAAATACRLLTGAGRPASVSELAEQLGRSRRSAIGTYGFDHGGFVIDRGRQPTDADLQIQKLTFPETWRMVIVSPSDRAGLSGSTEEKFFGERQYLELDVVQRLGELIDRLIVPALQSENFADFRTALQQYGDLVGQYYADQQGGIFSHPVIRELVPQLAAAGMTGAVQSSWGPSIALPADSSESAEDIVRLVSTLAGDRNLQAHVTQAANHGATVYTPAPDSQRSFG